MSHKTESSTSFNLHFTLHFSPTSFTNFACCFGVKCVLYACSSSVSPFPNSGGSYLIANAWIVLQISLRLSQSLVWHVLLQYHLALHPAHRSSSLFSPVLSQFLHEWDSFEQLLSSAEGPASADFGRFPGSCNFSLDSQTKNGNHCHISSNDDSFLPPQH